MLVTVLDNIASVVSDPELERTEWRAGVQIFVNISLNLFTLSYVASEGRDSFYSGRNRESVFTCVISSHGHHSEFWSQCDG